MSATHDERAARYALYGHRTGAVEHRGPTGTQHSFQYLHRNWWDDLSERITLARWMVDAGRLNRCDVLDVIEKPAKYGAEYSAMCVELTASPSRTPHEVALPGHQRLEHRSVRADRSPTDSQATKEGPPAWHGARLHRGPASRRIRGALAEVAAEHIDDAIAELHVRRAA